MIRGVWPIIRNCLGYSDQRLVEFACLCVIRVIDSYYRSSPENLENLVDAELIEEISEEAIVLELEADYEDPASLADRLTDIEEVTGIHFRAELER